MLLLLLFVELKFRAALKLPLVALKIGLLNVVVVVVAVVVVEEEEEEEEEGTVLVRVDAIKAGLVLVLLFSVATLLTGLVLVLGAKTKIVTCLLGCSLSYYLNLLGRFKFSDFGLNIV